MSGTPNTPLSHIHVDGHVDSSSRVQPPPTQPLLNGRKFSLLNAEDLAAMPDTRKASQEKLPTAPQATGAGLDKLQQAAETKEDEIPQTGQDFADALNDVNTDEVTFSKIDAVSGANTSPQVFAEHIATNAVASILTFNRTPFALAKDKAFEPMIMVNGHPIFIEKDGPHIVIGDVKNKGTLNEAREVSIALHAALESPAVSEASKAKLRAAIQAEDLPTLSREETTKIFRESVMQGVSIIKNAIAQFSECVSGIKENSMKLSEERKVNLATQYAFSVKLIPKLRSESSEMDFIAAYEIAEQRCPESLTEEMHARASALRKRGFSEQEKAEITKRRHELLKEFDAAVEYRLAQLEKEEAAHRHANFPLFETASKLLDFLRVVRKYEREEKIWLLLSQKFCMEEMRHNRRQLEKWLSEIRMKDDETFREGIKALDEAIKEMRDLEALFDKEFSQSRAEERLDSKITLTT